MPVTVEEKLESPSVSRGDNPNSNRVYVIRGTDDYSEALSNLESNVPAFFDGKILLNVAVEPVTNNLWTGHAQYGQRQSNPPTNTTVLSFETGGGTQHITQSINTRNVFSNADSPPMFGGAINVSSGNVDGVDITVPIYQFTITKYMPMADVTPEYREILKIATGKINSDVFGVAPAYTCLFLGASGTLRREGSGGDWEITFKFAEGDSVTDITIGDITGIEKLAWDYLWVLYEDVDDDSSKSLVKKPIAVYVEQVYNEFDFSLLKCD